MKKYLVRIPFTGVLEFEIDAESKSAAKEAAFDADYAIDCKSADDSVCIAEWETHDKIVDGNVFSGCMNEIEIREIK